MTRTRFARRVAAGAVAVALSVGGVLVGASPANAAAFEVTSTADSGAGSLREAIGLANASAGADVITFQSGLGDITLTSGAITVTGPLTLAGPGPNALSIVRSGSFDMFTVALVETGDVEASGLDFIGNSLTDSGRAIVVVATDPGLENLVLTNTRFGGFASADEGGAVAVYAAGGGVTVTDSQFALNSSTFPGGALYVGTIEDALQIAGSEFTGNSASEGGAVFANAVGAFVVEGSTFEENSAAVHGGAIALSSAAAASGIRLSTFRDNLVGAEGNTEALGGAIYIALIPGGIQFDISRTAVLGGVVVEGSSQSFGGGLFVDQTDGTLLVDSSTFASAQFVPNAGSSSGEGLSIALCDVAEPGTVRVINSTFDETSGSENYAIHACVNAGEIEILYSTFVVPGVLYINDNIGGAGIYSTILDAETNTDAVALGDGNLVQTSWSLFSTPYNPGFTTTGGGDRFGVTNPGLGPLALNGGPTPTRLPLVGGAAYDSGDPDAATLSPPTWDQRGSGFPRIDGRIDIGAVEIPRTLPSTGQPVSGAAGFASILLVIAGIGLFAQARRAVRRDRSRLAS